MWIADYYVCIDICFLHDFPKGLDTALISLVALLHALGCDLLLDVWRGSVENSSEVVAWVLSVLFTQQQPPVRRSLDGWSVGCSHS